jgi:hypothetical protein
MSQIALPLPSPFFGRALPRWSVGGQSVLVPLSMAGLRLRRAWVFVVPPLLASAPRRGLVTPKRSPPWLKAVVSPPPIRLWPPDKKVLVLPPMRFTSSLLVFAEIMEERI